MTDYQRGEAALKVFYDHWRGYPGANGFTFESFIQTLKNRRPMGGNVFVEGIGMGIREAGMSSTRVNAAMKNLAQASGGKIPAANMDFFNYLSNESTKINFVDAFSFTVVESVKDIGSAAQQVGNQIITTAKIMNFVLPAVLILGAFIWLNNKSGGEAERLLGKLARKARR